MCRLFRGGAAASDKQDQTFAYTAYAGVGEGAFKYTDSDIKPGTQRYYMIAIQDDNHMAWGSLIGVNNRKINR